MISFSDGCIQIIQISDPYALLGTFLAITICWSRTGNVPVTALAGVFGWAYVIYYVLLLQTRKLNLLFRKRSRSNDGAAQITSSN